MDKNAVKKRLDRINRQIDDLKETQSDLTDYLAKTNDLAKKSAIKKRLTTTNKQLSDLESDKAEFEKCINESTSIDDPYMAAITRDDDRPYMKAAHFATTSKTSDGCTMVNRDKPLGECSINEAFQFIIESLEEDDDEDDIMDQDISGLDNSPTDTDPSSDDDLIAKLNKLFTPTLVMQKYQKDIADSANNDISEATELTEANIISFDDQTRMSQLISVCALLIAEKKNTEKWQLFKKATAIKKQTKLDIQKEEYNEAKALAQKYLVNVATTNNSSVARQAANDLLPQTNH